MWAVDERGSTRNGKKDAWPLDCLELTQIAVSYEMWNSEVAVQWWWRTVKRRNGTIRQETIKNCHSKLLTTGSVTDAQRSGRPSTPRSKENVALVPDMINRSSRKSTRQAARESGLMRHTVRTVLKKDLNFRPREPHYVQEPTPEDWPQSGICWVGTRIGQNSLKAFPGPTRPFSFSAVSSVDINAITGRHTIPKWRWRRCKIVQKWPCGAEWRPLGSSAHIFCVTPWMPNAIFRCWKITCGVWYLAGKTSMNLFSCTMAHRHILHWAYVSGLIRSCRDVGWDD